MKSLVYVGIAFFLILETQLSRVYSFLFHFEGRSKTCPPQSKCFSVRRPGSSRTSLFLSEQIKLSDGINPRVSTVPSRGILNNIKNTLQLVWYGSGSLQNHQRNASTDALINSTDLQLSSPIIPSDLNQNNYALIDANNSKIPVVLPTLDQEFSTPESAPIALLYPKNQKQSLFQRVKQVVRSKDKDTGNLVEPNTSRMDSPKGFRGLIQRTFRRKVLNLFDRSDRDWAAAIDFADNDDPSSFFLVSDRKMVSSSTLEPALPPSSNSRKVFDFILRNTAKGITAPVRFFIHDVNQREASRYQIFGRNDKQQSSQKSARDRRAWMEKDDLYLPIPPMIEEESRRFRWKDLFGAIRGDNLKNGHTKDEKEAAAGYFRDYVQSPPKMIKQQSNTAFDSDPSSKKDVSERITTQQLRARSQNHTQEEDERSNNDNGDDDAVSEKGSEVTVSSLKNLWTASKEVAIATGRIVGDQARSVSVFLPSVSITWPWERRESSEETEIDCAFPIKETPPPPATSLPPLSLSSAMANLSLNSSTGSSSSVPILQKRKRSVLRYFLPITSTVLSLLRPNEENGFSAVQRPLGNKSKEREGEEEAAEQDGVITDEHNLPPEIRFEMAHPERDYLESLSQLETATMVRKDATGGLLGAIPIIGKKIAAARSLSSPSSLMRSEQQGKEEGEKRESPQTAAISESRNLSEAAEEKEEGGGLLQAPSSLFFNTIAKTAEVASKLRPPSIDSLPTIPFPNLVVSPPPSSSLDELIVSSSPAAAQRPALTIPPPGITIDESYASEEGEVVVGGGGSKYGRAQDMLQRPKSLPNIPVASTADFNFLFFRQIINAISASLQIKTEQDGELFMKTIGLRSLVDGILTKEKFDERYDRVDAVKGLCQLMRSYRTVADQIGPNKEIITVLCDMMETPFKGFLRSAFRNSQERDKELRAQHEAVALIHRLVRTSDIAVLELRQNQRLRKILNTIIQAEAQLTSSTTGTSSASSATTGIVTAGLPQPSSSSISSSNGMVGGNPLQSPSSSNHNNNNNALKHLKGSQDNTTILIEPIQLSFEDTKAAKSYVLKKRNGTTIVEYVNLKPHQMARVALWGLGGVPWKLKQPGQKGLRILSFDGGGTRGVLSIAYVKEIFKRLGKDSLQPHQVFDIICGTSTGGIIAMLFGAQRNNIEESEQLYDDFIGKIFASKSNLKLVTEKALYDEKEFEKILYAMCGDQLLLDSNQNECARVFCLSTKFNSNPPQTQIWRNYNYPVGARVRNPGAFRVNTLTAVRATTAAPTFFTPVPWEGGLYCDGALVANNPTAIAIEEARALYPDVPIELIVSIGTGVYVEDNKRISSMGWDLLVSQLVASSTDTEDTHNLLRNFLSPEQYYRFNPILKESMAIDEKDKNVLNKLKDIAKKHCQELFDQPLYPGNPNRSPSVLSADPEDSKKRYDLLLRALKGKG